MKLKSCLFLAVVLSACTSRQETKESSPTSTVSEIPKGNAVEGKALYTTCATCHGAGGEGKIEMNAPALVDTDDWYLYRQLMNFKKDIRGFSQHDTLGFQMAAMAKTLKDSIAVSHVVAYIKSMPPVTLVSLVSGDIKKGERTYQSVCGSCHGAGAKGNEKMNAPRLNGLDDWYIMRQISNFKNSIRGAHPNDKFGAQMVPMMALLKDDRAVDDIIAYIRSTTPSHHE